MTTEMNNPLSHEQRARIEALKAARDVLASRAGFGGSNVPEQFDHHDIITVANWILEGEITVSGTVEVTLNGVYQNGNEWKTGYSEGAHSAVNRYRQLAMDHENPGDQVLSDLLGDNAHRREPKAEPLPEAAVSPSSLPEAAEDYTTPVRDWDPPKD